jgi:hypothetical protein
MKNRRLSIMLSSFSVLMVFVCRGSYSYWVEHQPLTEILDDLMIMFVTILLIIIVMIFITIIVIASYRPKK